MSSAASFQPSRAGLSPRQGPVQMSFPPPPTTEIKSSDKKKHVPLALNFKSQSRHSSGSDTSSINSITLQKAPKPILRRSIKSTKRTRQCILLSLLILSFIVLILSTINSYCAALPHSDNLAGSQATSLAAVEGWNGPVTSTISLTRTTTATTTATPTAAGLAASLQPPRRHLLTRDYQSQSDSQSLNDEVNAALDQDATDHALFSTPSAQAALVFYTATLPFLTMLHTAVELLISLAHPATSQHTKIGDKLLFRSASSSGAAAGVLQRRRTGTLFSFAAAALLIPGWFIINIFTVNCEIVTFGKNGESVCPVQIRGHRMGGVSELSVGKVVLGCLVMVGYLAYCVYLVRVVGVFGGRGSVDANKTGGRNVSGFRRRARFAIGEGDKEREAREGTFTVIGVDGSMKGGVAV